MVPMVVCAFVAGPAWAQVEDPGTFVVPIRPPIVVAPRPPPVVLPRLPAAAGTDTRTIELADASGAHRFKVTLTAPRTTDARALDYLARTLRIVAVATGDRSELVAWGKHAGPESPGADVTVTIAALDGAKPEDFAALPPDGVEVIRPGTLRVRDELLAGLERTRDFRFTEVARRRSPGPPPPPGPAREGLHGTLLCRAADDTHGATTARALPFVTVKAADGHASTSDTGEFTIPGSFRPGSFTIEIVYDGAVTASGLVTSLQVMAELHTARSESVSRTATLTGDQMSVGTVELNSVDCELWRLGAEVLVDYHQTVGRPPPAHQLRLKRWSGVWVGVPYTYYDYLVLVTDFGAGSGQHDYRDLNKRRRTIYHEFGHSVRHVADGSELHWGWDNFRWAYARFHDGCETYNTQYAFNEGWAGYWAAERGSARVRNCGKAPAFVDWTESMISDRLLTLALALSPDPKVRASKMVEVLERNPRTIHSLREFELKYCALHAAGNPECTNASTPRRPEPASCPPGYHDDGATCRLVNILAKDSYGRGVGTVPNRCGDGRVLDAGLCYPKCKAGYDGVGPVCWHDCPSGFRDDGAYCAKPEAYGRGVGYPWKPGDTAFDLTEARKRCQAAHSGGCEQNGLIFYPKCRAGFHAFACCVCTPNCPAGMTDIGVSCQKQAYGRGVGTVPTGCGGKEYDAGLCYPTCKAEFVGVGPVCWKQGCPAGFDDHGATCYRAPNILVKY